MTSLVSNTSFLSNTSSFSMKSSVKKTDLPLADINTRDWMSTRDDSTITISRHDILENAWKELKYFQGLSNNPDNDLPSLNETVLHITKAILTRVIRDNSPTPQFAPHPDGSIDIQWWVGNEYLIIIVEPFMISFAAWYSDYSDIFPPVEVVFDKNNHVDAVAREELDRGFYETEKLLKDMSSKVTKRRLKRI